MAENSRLERQFQAKLIKEIKDRFEGCVVLKTDPNYIQGFPDLLILHKNRWAALEVKRNKGSVQQPNQEWYVNSLNGMSFASFVHPENKEEVLNELQQAFEL